MIATCVVHSLRIEKSIMRRINLLILALFATLAFAACKDDNGDDDKVDCTLEENKDHEDCKKDDVIDCEDPANAEHEDCVVDGWTPPADATNLCTGQEAEYAAIDDISGLASDVAQDDCEAIGFIFDPPTAEELEDLEACVAVGIAETEGVDIDENCAYCTSKVVTCVVLNCGLKCKDDPSSDECLECQDEHKCQEGYDECQGLDAGNTEPDCEEDPTAEGCDETTDPVACTGDEEVDAEDCIDCEDPENEEHAACVE